MFSVAVAIQFGSGFTNGSSTTERIKKTRWHVFSVVGSFVSRGTVANKNGSMNDFYH